MTYIYPYIFQCDRLKPCIALSAVPIDVKLTQVAHDLARSDIARLCHVILFSMALSSIAGFIVVSLLDLALLFQPPIWCASISFLFVLFYLMLSCYNLCLTTTFRP